MPQRRRLDRELVERALVPDEQQARILIAERRILVDGAPALAPSRLVAASDDLNVLQPPAGFVTRGGRKLAGALEDFGIPVTGRHCLDAGAGAGGFTDCLLQAGAASVVAVDVGYGDFAWPLRNDPRVRLLERANLRTLELARLGGPFDLVVADLSFISLASVADRLVAAAGPGADLVALVKPQFEAPRADVPVGGVVRDAAVWGAALDGVLDSLAALGMPAAGVAASQLRGRAGNQEFFVWARRDARPTPGLVQSAVTAAQRVTAAQPEAGAQRVTAAQLGAAAQPEAGAQ